MTVESGGESRCSGPVYEESDGPKAQPTAKDVLKFRKHRRQLAEIPGAYGPWRYDIDLKLEDGSMYQTEESKVLYTLPAGPTGLLHHEGLRR